MKKRIIAIFTVLMMIVPLALSPAYADAVPKITLSDKAVAVGASGNLAISIENNPGVYYIELKLTFDTSALSAGNAVSVVSDCNIETVAQSTGVKLVVEFDENNFNDGVIARLPVTVAANAEAGEYPVTVTVQRAYNEAINMFDFTPVSGTVTVTAQIPDITFTAQSVAVNASNIESFRQADGSLIVPVAITASGIPADDGMAAFTLTVSSTATIASIVPGSAIYNTDQFHENNAKIVWVDTHEITAADAQVAIVNLAIPHAVAAGASYNVSLTPSDDGDDFLLIDVSNYNAQIANGTVSFAVGGHRYADTVIAATCTSAGYTKHTCSDCGNTYNSDTVAALGHSFGAWTVATAATCTTDGLERRVCSRDSSHVETRVINATGHSFGDWTVATAATCTADGLERRVCSNDPSHVETRVINATGHNYTAVVTAPTCTAAGYTTHTCSRCHDSYTDTPTTALGHNYGAWTVTTAATCTAAGVETRYCSRCDATESRAIPAAGHNFVDGVCSICGVSDPNATTLTVESLSITPGETFTLSVNIDPNPGINGATLWLYYDTENFSIKTAKIQQGSIWSEAYEADSANLMITKKVENGAAKITIGSIWQDEDTEEFLNSEGAGSVAKFTFTASADIAPGDYEFILNTDTATWGERAELLLTNVDKEKWTPAVVNGVVTVADNILWGDVNDDGDVDIADAIMIAQYTVDNSVVLGNEEAADVNRDGDVDIADAIMIAQFTVDNSIILGVEE